MAGDYTPPPTSADKLIPFSITNKVLIKLDLEKHNYNSWSFFFIIHLGSLGLKSHVEEEASSSTTNPEWAINLDNELRSIKIEKMTINEYCTKIKSMADRLNNLGCVLVHPTIANQLDQIPPSQDHVAYYAQQAQQPHLAYPVQLQDNDCTIKFDAFGFSVKEFLTRHILLRCDSSGDLYPVTKPSTIPTAFVSTSFSTWHQRLDDIILIAFSQALLQQLIDSLHSEFDMTDLGALNYFLGIFVVRHLTRLFLSQGKYALHLFEHAHMYTLSRSSAKAKYRGVANVVAKTTWLCNLLRELHSPLPTATLVYCDNVSATYMSANPEQHQWTKHIEIHIHFVRDMFTTGQVRALYVPSCYQYADVVTKGLPSALFEEF
nr:ribonuclease H-like domain-containing protein [Tanacetum cinerariifolium]